MKVKTFELHRLLSGTKLDMRYWSCLVWGSAISVVLSTLAWIIFMWKFRMSERMLFSTLAKWDSTETVVTSLRRPPNNPYRQYQAVPDVCCRQTSRRTWGCRCPPLSSDCPLSLSLPTLSPHCPLARLADIRRERSRNIGIVWLSLSHFLLLNMEIFSRLD